MYDEILADLSDEMALGPHVPELLRGWRAKQVLAEVEAKRLAARYEREGLSFIDGVGQLGVSVPEHYFWLYRRKYGEACWKDEGFLRFIRQKHPEFFPKSRSRKVGIVHPGLHDRNDAVRTPNVGCAEETAPWEQEYRAADAADVQRPTRAAA